MKACEIICNFSQYYEILLLINAFSAIIIDFPIAVSCQFVKESTSRVSTIKASVSVTTNPPDNPKRFYCQGRTAFMLEIEAITAEIAHGSVQLAWHARRERLGVSYVTFTRYVKKYIRKGDDAPVPQPHAAPCPPSPPPAAGNSAQIPPREPKRAIIESRKGFTVDPMAARTNNLV